MQVITVGLDLAKHVFQVHAVDASGQVVVRKALRRAQMLPFFAKLPPCLVGMEACGTSHHWARELTRLGHEIHLMPPAYVKPYVKRGKNDAVDAEAICEAVTRPTMRFVAVKSKEQQAALSLHRTRNLLVKQHTQLVNMIRGLLAEFGIDIPEGLERALGLARRIAAKDAVSDVPATAMQILDLLCGQVLDTHARLQTIDRSILALQRSDDIARRLSTIPGIGPVGATALDVSLEETSLCIVDETGRIVKEMRALSEPEPLVAALRSTNLSLERIGLEACSLAAWLHEGLRAVGLPAICIETRQANATMKTVPVKTDRNDARALAQIMRTGWFRQVHVKSRPCRLWRSALVARRTVLNEMRTIENVVRAILREAGIKLGTPSRAVFADKVREMAGSDPLVLGLVEPLLCVLATMLAELDRMTRQILAIVRAEPVCRRLMSVPGVGPITALAFRATIDDPDRFRHSRDVGAHLGLTPSRYQSGDTDITGRISRCGDELARTALYEAAHSLLTRSKAWSGLKAWGIDVARRRGMARARVAVARKLAVVLHGMWRDGTDFRFGKAPASAMPLAAKAA